MATRSPAILRGGGLLGMVIARDGPAADGPDAPVDVMLEDGRRIRIPSRFLAPRGDGTYELTAPLDEAVGPSVAEADRVRIRKVVRTVERVVNEPLAREELVVERVPINRVIDAPVGPRQEGETLIVPLTEEVLVIEKRLVLREEVRITRRRAEHRAPRTVTLRREEAVVERPGGGPDGRPVPDER